MASGSPRSAGKSMPPEPVVINMVCVRSPTISGGVTINNCMVHIAQHDQPFGGTGASGMGQYHGVEGFAEFSKLRPVFTAPKFDSTKQIQPPYKKRHSRMFKLMLRFKR